MRKNCTCLNRMSIAKKGKEIPLMSKTSKIKLDLPASL